jgi:hypothetical protein
MLFSKRMEILFVKMLKLIVNERTWDILNSQKFGMQTHRDATAHQVKVTIGIKNGLIIGMKLITDLGKCIFYLNRKIGFKVSQQFGFRERSRIVVPKSKGRNAASSPGR